MENDLTDQLTRLLIEQLREPHPTIQDRQLDTIYDLYHGYNDVMRQYQQNIGDLIRRIETAQNNNDSTNVNIPHNITPPRRTAQPRTSTQPRTPAQPRTFTQRPRTPVQPPASQRRSQPPGSPIQPTAIPPLSPDMQLLFTYLFQPNINNEVNTMRPLSREEISNATRTYGYTEEMQVQDPSGNVCPISLETYQVGDVICEIRGCNHIFRRPALMTWLRRNSRCPVCRYNLRDYVDQANEAPDQANEAPDQATPPANPIPFPSLVDLSGSRIFNFEFELPIQTDENDASDIEPDLSVD